MERFRLLIRLLMLVPLVSLMAMAQPQPTTLISTPSGPIDMPTVGLGSCFGFTPPASTTDAYEAVLSWLRAGGRGIHTAWMYCNQEAIGRAIRDSRVPRSEIFVMTMSPQWMMGYNETITSVEHSLRQVSES